MDSERDRPPVTVAVLSDGDKRQVRDALSHLEGQLRRGDNAVVLVPGRAADAPAAWRDRRSNGALAKTAVRPPVQPLVLVLDDRVTPSDGLVDELARHAGQPGVGAVAARSNLADGDDLLVGLPYRPGDVGARRSFLRTCATQAAGRAAEAQHLGGPCVLLHRSDLEATGGLAGLAAGAGLDPLLAGLAAAGRRLVVAEGAYAHHPGGTPRRRSVGWPLVSACLIVKDEEAQLATCLASASAVADEVVVYDTGSTDGTVALARKLGATVVEGDWDGDFARARNAALESCRGQWILWLDADETLVCDDPAALRSSLAGASAELEGFLVLIDNLQGTEAATTLSHPAARLFRRGSCRWEGRLHEQIVRRLDGAPPVLLATDAARILHRGYLQLAVRDRAKGERNIRTAFADLVGGSELDHATRVLSLARSYMLAQRYEEGLELAERALQLARRPGTHRLALRALAEGNLALGRNDEALDTAASMREAAERPFLADVVEGRAHLAAGRPEAALTAFERLQHVVVDDDGFEYRPSLVTADRARALVALERHAEAAHLLLRTLAEEGGLDVHLGMLVEALQREGRDLAEIRAVLPDDRLVAFVPQLLQLQPAAADAVLEAWQRPGETSLPLLAAAAQLATLLPVERRLVWSARLRAAGLASACPLVASAVDDAQPVRDRLLCAAVAVASFADRRARQAFLAAAPAVEDGARAAVRAEIELIAPELARHLVAASRPTVDPAGEQGRASTAVVVGRTRGGLAEQGLAAALAADGWSVLLLQPGPVARAAGVLPGGVEARMWPEASPADWAAACAATLAQIYATQPVDAIVLGAGTETLSATLQRIVPTSRVVAARDLARTPSSVGPDLAPAGPTEREGCCLLADLRADPALARRLPGRLAELAAALGDVPISHLGDDPDRQLAAELPGLVAVGATFDPGTWCRAARVVLALPGPSEAAARALARSTGTPLVLLEGDDLPALVAQLTALLYDDAAWAAAAPSASASDPVAGEVLPLPRRTQPALVPAGERGSSVRWVGEVASLNSLAQVNRELLRRLPAMSSLEFVVATLETGALDGVLRRTLGDVELERPAKRRVPDLEVRHQWPPDFTRPAGDARLVCIQPFEFGGLPAEWVGPLRDVVDELWVPTSWVRDRAVDSGVPAEKVVVVPNGVDGDRFRPDGDRYQLATRKTTKLLFVGGCIPRKGIDVLLETYLSTFGPEDDVCLVVKPYGTTGVYRGSSLEGEVRRAAAGDGAAIEVVDDTLSADELAALYRSCDALVHPYRGEGFGLPVAEAMASGLPVVVTAGGACDDFCDEQVGWMLPSRRVSFDTKEWTPSAGGTWWLEPSRAALAEAMRSVVADPDEARRRGANGRARALATLGWDRAAEVALGRIEALLGLAEPATTAGERAAS